MYNECIMNVYQQSNLNWILSWISDESQIIAKTNSECIAKSNNDSQYLRMANRMHKHTFNCVILC